MDTTKKVQKGSVLFKTFNEMTPFEKKINRMLLIEKLQITSQTFRNWLSGINEPTKTKKLLINQIIGKPIY